MVYPGIGLGVIASKAKEVTDNMLNAACQALAEKAPTLKDPLGALLPAVHDAPNIAKDIAMAVANQAVADGVATICKESDIIERMKTLHWEPHYIPFKLAD